MRYYVAWSSWFDSHPYSVPKIKKAVSAGGGTNIRTANQFGWSNQPAVVTFDGYPQRVEKAVRKALGTSYIIVREKDWK